MSLAAAIGNAISRKSGALPTADVDAAEVELDVTPNPYLNARRTWNAHTGSVVSSRQMWQIAGLLCLLICLSAVGGMVYIGSQSKFIPYMVPVDRLAQAGSPLVLDRAAATDPRVIHATVAAFLSDARLVTPDIALQRKAVFRLYAHMASSDPAATKMNEWLNGSPTSSPFKRAENETVNTEILSVIAQTPDSWQVDWSEIARDRTGAVKSGPTRMRALVTVYVVPPNSQITEEQIRDNPLQIFVRDFNWSKQL
jgi:type IV secretory pathway TrbF-like protein